MLNAIFKSHRTSLKSETAEPQKVFAMLKLIPQGEAAGARPPLAFAFVIDTSGSMQEFADQEKAKEEAKRLGLSGDKRATADGGLREVNLTLPTKLDRAIEAAHRLVDDARLEAGDQVTLIQFDDNASVLLPLTPVANKQAAHQAIDGLRKHSGGTHMAKGLEAAKRELSSLPNQIAKRVLLLTDGETFDEERCRPVAKALGETNTPVIAIGLGVEYNDALMLEMAQLSQGRPYHLQEIAQLETILDEEVGASVKEVVTDLQASLSAVRGVTLDNLTRVYPSLSEVGVGEQPYRLGNIVAGDYTVFVMEFTIGGIARPPSRARVAQVGLSGFVPGLNRRDELPPQDLFLSFTSDERQIAEVDPEVLGYVQQKNVDRMLQDAVRQATVDPGRARQTLQVARNMTLQVGNANVTKMLDNALEELNESGKLSGNTRKTLNLGGRTRTIKPGGTAAAVEGVPSEEEIRRLTGA